MTTGVLVKIVAEFILIGIPDINIYGAPISTFLCDLVITVINLFFISKQLKGNSFEGYMFLKTMCTALLSIGVSLLVYIPMSIKTGNIKLSFIVALPITVIAYVIISFMIKAISLDDLEMLPFGDKIKKYFFREIKKEN